MQVKWKKKQYLQVLLQCSKCVLLLLLYVIRVTYLNYEAMPISCNQNYSIIGTCLSTTCTAKAYTTYSMCISLLVHVTAFLLDAQRDA